MNILLFLTAVSLSSIAAYYSIVGLIAIFSAAAQSITVMGSVLEVSKIVTASWLTRNWKKTPFLLKTYFTTAIIVLMLLTSIGIFGFLSKAHLDQSTKVGDVAYELSVIDEQIKTEKEKINEYRKTLSQLDQQVNEALARTAKETNTRAVNLSVTIRRRQASERKEISKQIQQAQAEIQKLNEVRAPKAAEIRKVEVEVGPIKYVSALIYGEEKSKESLEDAVRILILMIVFTFDPLAVLMFIAIGQNRKEKIKPKLEEPIEQTIVQKTEQPIEQKVEKVLNPSPKNNSKSLSIDSSIKIKDQTSMSKG